MTPSVSPAIVGVPRRSTHGPCDEGRAVERAMLSAVGVNVPMPVLFGTKNIGTVIGDGRNGAYYWPKYYCGFTSVDDIINKVTVSGKRLGIPFSRNFSGSAITQWTDLWPTPGTPAAGLYTGTALTARSLTSSDQGSLPIGANVSPSTRCYAGAFCSYFGNSTANSMSLMLYDRVLSYDGNSFSTGAQNMTNTVPASRYISGTQTGLQACMTLQAAIGATAADISVLTYSNQASASKTMPTTPTVSCIVSLSLPAVAGGFPVIAPATSGNLWGPFIPLASGDSGMKSITNITFSGQPTGTFCLFLCRPIGVVPLTSQGGPATAVALDTIQAIETLPTIQDGACLAFLALTVSATGTFAGEVNTIWT